MKTRSEIWFNYRQSINQADQLDALAVKIQRQANQNIKSSMEALRGAWESDNSGRLISKAEQVRQDIQKQAGNLKQAANNLRVTAERIRKTELRILEIAELRQY